MLFIPFAGPTKFSRDALLVFLGSDEPDWVEIKDAFKEWSETNVVPPEIVVLAAVDWARKLREASEIDSESQAAIEVVRKLSNVRLFSFDGSGNIAHVEPNTGQRLSIDGTAEILVPAVSSFVESELENGSVVVAAPPGFYFAKQSDRHSSHFIRTESLLSCTESIELLALRLLKVFRTYCDALDHSKVRILVDSMVIWPLAQALVAMRRSADPKRRYVIKSFRSYEGLAEDCVESGPAFAIISASTSGGLARLLQDKIGTSHVTCLTVLGLEPKEQQQDSKEKNDKENDSQFVVPRKLTGSPSLSGLRATFETDITDVPPGCESVRIIGERFLNQNFRPKAVRLAHGALEDARKQTLANIARERHALAARRRSGGKSYWSVSFDIAALVNRYCQDDENGECLLRSWLTNYAVAGDVAIVYPVDTLEGGRPDQGESRRMAERIRELLSERSPAAGIRILNSAELDTPASELVEFMKQAAVVVAAPVVGNGFVFKQISAALRSVQPKGPRLYITLAALPESKARLDELRADLQSNADERAYHFKSAIALPVGKLDQDIDWHEESMIMARVVETCEEEGIVVPPLLRERLAKFRAGNGLVGELAFLPSYGGGALAMSPGFLLWQTKVPIAGSDLGACVLMTVAVFLEACRSGGARNGETSLVSGLFQQTLVAPANFTRFNDPAIQAALLRAAYRSELNFASSPDMSSDMQRLILRLMRLHDSPAGDALPEFLLALVMRRLTLHKDHMQEVRDQARALPGWLGSLAEGIA